MTAATGYELDSDVWEVDSDALVVVACSGKKLDHAAPARELYTGDLFRASVTWARSHGLRWTILSALHGIVGPGQVLDPYDYRLDDVAVYGEWVALRRRVRDVLQEIDPRSIVALGGANYVAMIREAAAPDLHVWAPLQQLPGRGIGYYKSWLARNTARQSVTV